MSVVSLQFYRGSNGSFEFNWPDGAGGNLDLSGWDIRIFEASAGCGELIVAQIAAPEEGLVTVDVKWSDRMKADRLKFRLQIYRGDDKLSFPEFVICYI